MNIVMLGAPGAGKGTHADFLAQQFGIVHISTGELLRQQAAQGTELGLRVKGIMERGELVDDDLVTEIVNDVAAKEHRGLVLDGFPRTIRQAELLDQILHWAGSELACVLNIDVPEEELVRRIKERAMIVKRNDEGDDTIRRRLQEYHSKTLPVKSFYEDQGILVNIDAGGSIEQTRTNIMKAVAELG